MTEGRVENDITEVRKKERSFKLPGTFESRAVVHEELHAALQGMEWSADEIDEFVETAVGEAVANAVKYGCGNADGTGGGEKEFEIEYVVTPQQVRVVVRDPGKGFDHEHVADPRVGDNVLEPHGRGVFFMRQFADEVRFNESGNEVTLVKNRKKA